jgi:hypothetical protein
VWQSSNINITRILNYEGNIPSQGPDNLHPPPRLLFSERHPHHPTHTMWTMLRGGEPPAPPRPIKAKNGAEAATCHREGSQRQLATLPPAHRYWFPSAQIFDLLQLQRTGPPCLPTSQRYRQRCYVCMYPPRCLLRVGGVLVLACKNIAAATHSLEADKSRQSSERYL